MNFKEALKIEGHRGAIGKFRENSLEAFLEADRLGIDGVELDLWLTKDGVPVISHGSTKEGMEPLVSSINKRLECVYLPRVTYAELQGYCYPKSDLKVPTFREALASLQHTSMYLNVELKDPNPALIEKTLAIIKEVEPKPRVYFSSFKHSKRQLLDDWCERLAIQRFPFGYLLDYGKQLPDLEALFPTMIPGQDSLNIDIQFVLSNDSATKEYLRKAAELGFKVKCYNLMVLTELEDEELYHQLTQYGVETFICNKVERLREYNASRRPLPY